jgi:type II secretion system protein H
MCRYSNAKIVRHGFTMIELLIVVAILAIAAAIVVPMAASAGSMQLRAAANMVAADLEYAKSMSISRGQRYSVVFDADHEKYWIVSGDQHAVQNAIQHPVKKGLFRYVVDFRADGRLDHVEIANVTFGGTPPAVSFDFLGSPDNGGVITLQAGGLTRTVNVEPVTGYISVSN